MTPDSLPEALYDQTAARRLSAPHPDTFVRCPQSWHFVARSRELPVGTAMTIEAGGRRLVAFRGRSGNVHAVDARCPHLGSNLGHGRVVGDAIECPYHHFRFGGDGRCAQARDLRALVLPTAERYGAVFVFTGAGPAFPFPGFDEEPNLVHARPLHFTLETPWYMVSANAFDARHFGAAHGRRLTGKPRAWYADTISAHFACAYAIEGSNLMDRAIRAVSGHQVAFEVTSLRGNVLLVRARFRHDASFGIVVIAPHAARPARTDVTVIINARRSRAPAIADRLRTELKRIAIRRMLLDDFGSLQGLDYRHDGLQPGDELLAGYLRWLYEATQESDRG